MAFWSSDEYKDWELRPLKSSSDKRVSSTGSDSEDSGKENNRKQSSFNKCLPYWKKASQNHRENHFDVRPGCEAKHTKHQQINKLEKRRLFFYT